MTGLDFGLNGFTYFPILPYHGLAGVGSTYGGVVSPYGTTALPAAQVGFYSVYLPGYTRRPLGLGLPGGLTHTTYPPYRVGGPLPTAPRLPVGVRPVAPPPHVPVRVGRH